MRVDQVHGLLQPAFLQQVDQPRMIVEQVAIVEIGGDERAQQRGAAHQLRVDVLHHLVAAEAHEQRVEFLAEHVGQGIVAGSHGLALPLDMLAQLCPAGAGRGDR